MVEILIFYFLLLLGTGSNVIHPKWYIWLIPVWIELGKAISKFFASLSKEFPILAFFFGLASIAFLYRVLS